MGSEGGGGLLLAITWSRSKDKTVLAPRMFEMDRICLETMLLLMTTTQTVCWLCFCRLCVAETKMPFFS